MLRVICFRSMSNINNFYNSTVKPDPPQSVMITSKTSRTIAISWKSGFDGNSEISSYTVEISEDNLNFGDGYCQGLSNSSCRLSGKITNASLEGLHPGRMYYFRVFANNTVGQSEASSIINATTDEEGTCTVLIVIIFLCFRGQSRSRMSAIVNTHNFKIFSEK